jgi:hypothetical protein
VRTPYAVRSVGGGGPPYTSTSTPSLVPFTLIATNPRVCHLIGLLLMPVFRAGAQQRFIMTKEPRKPTHNITRRGVHIFVRWAMRLYVVTSEEVLSARLLLTEYVHRRSDRVRIIVRF